MALRRIMSAAVTPILLGLAVFGLDRWSKDAVIGVLPVYSSREIIPGFFDLVHTRNTGIAFSLFADSGPLVRDWLLPIASIVAILFVGAYFWKTARDAVVIRFALTLVLAGAAGNLYDRALYGYVTDFLDIYVGAWHWPAFNVADSAITIGAGLLLLDSFRKPAAASGGERAQPASS